MKALGTSVLIVAVIVSLVAATRVSPLLLRSDAPALEVTTTIAPVTKDAYQLLRRPTPGILRCSVLVHDEPGSRRVWGTKDILLGPGEKGEETAALGPLQLTFRAEIAQGLDRAETSVTVSRDSRVITRQISTVWLERPSARLRPVL
jgi:hypothetical protein